MLGNRARETGCPFVPSSLCAFFALVLGAMSVYGVVAHSVAHREREFGIRIAMGAASTSVLKGVLVQGLRLAMIGALLGLGATWYAMRLPQGLLYQVSSRDPSTCGGGLF